MLPFLTLDHSTLFYWMLSDASRKKQKQNLAINEWASGIPRSAKATFSTRTSGSAKSAIQNGGSRLSESSVLTKNVKIFAHQPLPLAEPASATVPVDSNGGLSDNDKLQGEERIAAINSPPKGRKRVTSEVSLLGQFLLKYLPFPNSATRTPEVLNDW
jgi:hypothetical protein